MAALGDAFGVDHPIRRIEVYDNSHIMGTNADRRHDRRRPRGLRQEPVPQLQHQEPRSHARRRLRDDARSADAPLRAAHAPRRNGGGGPISRHARSRHDRRRARAARGGARRDRRAWRRGRAPGRDRQGARPRRGARDLLHGGAGALQARAPATRLCSSSSACATKPTASPSAPTGRGARRNSSKARSTRSPASGLRASGRCCSLSARPRTSPKRALRTSKRRPASTPRRRSSSTTFFMRAARGGGDGPYAAQSSTLSLGTRSNSRAFNVTSAAPRRRA